MLFMAPEQMFSPKNADARMDIWALGVSLHYLITRSYPFQATTVPELCAMILQRDPTPLRAARPDVPARLEVCILRCLQKAPEERYANVAELAEALIEFAPPSAIVSVERTRRMLSFPGRVSSTSYPELTAGMGRAETAAVAQGLPTGPPVAVRVGAATSSAAGGTTPLFPAPIRVSSPDGAAGRPAEREEPEDATRKVAGKPVGSLFLPVVIGVTIMSILVIVIAGVAWSYASGPSAAQAPSVAPERVDLAAPAAPPSSAAPVSPNSLAPGLPSNPGSAAPNAEGMPAGSASARASAAKPVATATPSARPSAAKGAASPTGAPHSASVSVSPAPEPSPAPTPTQAPPPAGEQKRPIIMF